MTDSSFLGARYQTLLTDSPAPGVARLTLNRPAAMNAYSFRDDPGIAHRHRGISR